jgi:hypothetical protein
VKSDKLPSGAFPLVLEAPFHVEQVFTFDPSTGCGGAAGLTVGPDHQALPAAAPIRLVVDDRTGLPLTGGVLAGEAGADEVWFNLADNHYFLLRRGGAGCRGRRSPPSVAPSAITGPGSHSVAADPRRNQVYVPIRGNNGRVPPSTGAAAGATCSTANDASGNAGSDALGHIAIYTAARNRTTATPDAEGHKAQPQQQ